MKTNNSAPLSPIEVCTLMAHEAVALLDVVDDDVLDAAADFREALKVFSTAQGLGEDGETLLAWVDAEIENAKRFAAGGEDSPHLIDPDRLLPVHPTRQHSWTQSGCSLKRRRMNAKQDRGTRCYTPPICSRTWADWMICS